MQPLGKSLTHSGLQFPPEKERMPTSATLLSKVLYKHRVLCLINYSDSDRGHVEKCPKSTTSWYQWTLAPQEALTSLITPSSPNESSPENRHTGFTALKISLKKKKKYPLNTKVLGHRDPGVARGNANRPERTGERALQSQHTSSETHSWFAHFMASPWQTPPPSLAFSHLSRCLGHFPTILFNNS